MGNGQTRLKGPSKAIDMNEFIGIGVGIVVIAAVVWVLFEIRGGIRLGLKALRLQADALEQQKYRRNAMNQVAKELGLSFQPVAHASLVDEWSIPDCELSSFQLSSSKLEWRGHRIANVCRGTVGDAEVYLCDSENTFEPRGELSGDYEPDFTFAFFRSTALDLPQFTLEQVRNWKGVPRPWQIFMRLMSKILYFVLRIFTKWRFINGEGDLRFAGKFELAATDENAVRRLFSEEVQSFFADQATVSVRGDGQTLILLHMETVVGIRMGTKVHRNLKDELHHGGKLIPPDEIPSFFEECVRVYDLLKQRLRSCES